MSLPNILFPAFMFAFIFHRRSFSPCLPLAFLIFSPPLWISMFFSLQNSSRLFSITRSSSFSVIHVSVKIIKNAEKDTTLLLFFLSKSPRGHGNKKMGSPCLFTRQQYLKLAYFYWLRVKNSNPLLTELSLCYLKQTKLYLEHKASFIQISRIASFNSFLIA